MDICRKDDLPIKGTLLVISHSVNEKVFMRMGNTLQLKHALATKLAEYLINSDLIEFTKIEEPTNCMTRYYARVCLVPKNIVQILKKTT